ncbi:MAG: peptide chain release factor aRF-1 [Candidatus Odinarchaeota archaeon]|nr:peptide chain release factor aRF-1 [Candidatus Odinarchaeota archaeon]
MSKTITKKLDYLERRKLTRIIERLSKYKGRHSSLTTLYIPSSKNLVDVINFLKQEYETAGNIKDKTNRKMVQDNLQKMINELQKYKKLPENGVALFFGYHEIGEGSFEEIKEIIVPPLPIKQFIYICGKEFYVEPLKEMAAPRNIIGVVILEAGHYTIALIKGKHIEILKDDDYYIIGKTRRGGQSARRFERLREEQVNNFYKHLAKEVNELFLPMINDIEAVVFGGNTLRAMEFLEKDLLDYRIKNKIISKVIPTSLINPQGVFQMTKEIAEIIKSSEIARERKLWEDFKEKLARNDKLITYGKDEVLDLLKQGRVDTVLISENMGDLVDEIIELAEQFGTKVEIFSSQTESGQELLAFGGIVAFLRW